MRFLQLLLGFCILAISLPVCAQTDSNVVKVDSALRKPGTKINRPDSTAINKKLKATAPGVPKDSARLVLERLPKESLIRSLIVPGLGQIHNKRYWKVPIVYAGYVTLGFFYNVAQHNYRQTLHEVQYRLLNNRQVRDSTLERYSFETLVSVKDYYRRNRDLTILGFMLWHTFQAIDAYVDAKLFRYDITPEITLHLSPFIEQRALAAVPVSGIKLSLTF